MKNKNLLFIVIFFISTFIWCQEDLDVDISNFYKRALNNPFITLDPSYNTVYYMDPYNPNIFIDHQILNIKINASSLAPMGTYAISPLYLNFTEDTLSSTAFEHNKGDYGYYENIIFINNKYKNNLSSFLMIQGKKYDGLESINSDSELLQNYFFNVTKNYPQLDGEKIYGSITNSLMYHKENSIIPTNNSSSYIRNSDSYLYGLSVDANYSNFFKFNFSTSSQLTRGNHYIGLNLDEYTNWIDSDISFRLNDYISIQSSFNNKENSIESNSFYNKIILSQIFLIGQFNYKDMLLNLGLAYHYTSMIKTVPRLNFNFIYNPNPSLSLSFNKTNNSFINRNYTAFDSLAFNLKPINIMDTYSLKANYINESISFIFEPFYLVDYFYNGNHYYEPNFDSDYKNEITGLNTSLSLRNNYIISDFNLGVYQTQKAIPINFYSNYSILFAPKINNKRFRPFIGLDGTYMGLNPSSYIDVYSRFIDVSWDDNNFKFFKNINLLSFQLGFILNQFKISYHWTNPMDENILFSFSNSYQSIKPFSKLQVTWQFLD